MKLAGLLAVLLVGIAIEASAQKFELGKVSIEELKETRHPKDTSAAAAVLFRTGETTYNYSERDGFMVTTKVKTRIKIYKKDGYEWANSSIGYYSPAAQRESLHYDDAVTYNLVDGKIIKTKLKSDGQFDENINKYWSAKKITMPAVKEGSVIEYEYTLTSPNLNLRDWSFQLPIPVNYSEYLTIVPEYFVYKTSFKGSLLPKITTDALTKNITLISKERSEGAGPTKTTFSQQKIDYQAHKTNYLALNLPAMKEEEFVNNISNYTSSLGHELTMVKYPNAVPKIYSTDWESVTRSIYDDPDFGEELDKYGYFEDDLKTLLTGVNGSAEKMNLIFDFVKKQVKWDSFVGYSCNSGVRKAYKEGVGNVAEINLMLIAMLRHAGFTANPVLVSTRSNGVAMFPSRTAYNYVIAAVETPGGKVLLDASEKYSSPGIVPTRVLNWFGRLIRKDKSSQMIELMPKNASKEVVNIQYAVSEEGEVTGKLRRQLTNYIALEFRSRYVGTEIESYLESLENRNGKIEISDYVRQNELEIAQPFMESYNFRHHAAADVISDKIYLAPMLFLAQSENPFKQESREYPVDFSYPKEFKYNINIEIPAGYTIESLPATTAVALENNTCAFKYLIAEQGNKIQLSFVFNINEAILSADYYAALKDYFQKLVEKQNEKIVLRKL